MENRSAFFSARRRRTVFPARELRSPPVFHWVVASHVISGERRPVRESETIDGLARLVEQLDSQRSSGLGGAIIHDQLPAGKGERFGQGLAAIGIGT